MASADVSFLGGAANTERDGEREGGTPDREEARDVHTAPGDQRDYGIMVIHPNPIPP